MAKKTKHFISGAQLREQAGIVQKYNRLCAYLGGDNELLVKILRRIEDYKVLEQLYESWKSGNSTREAVLAVVVKMNKNKKWNFIEKMLKEPESDSDLSQEYYESIFLRRLDESKAIEADYNKFKDQPKEVKDRLFRSIIDNPSYKYAKNVLGEGMVLMCDKWATKPSYSGYSQDRKDEMKSDACMSMLRGIEGYDCGLNSSIFAYFTETIKNCYNSYCANKKKEAENEVGLDFIDNIQEGFRWENFGE